MLDPLRGAGHAFLRSRPQVLRYTLLFRLIEAVVLTPASAVAGQFLSGQSVIDSTDLVQFALSPRGFLATFLAATLLVTYRLIEQVGVTAILLSADKSPLDASGALRLVARLGPRLLTIAATILAAVLALAAPLLIAAGILARRLLALHDINFYLAERPPEFLTAVGILSLIAVPTVAAAVWLAVRWRLIVPILLCEQGKSWKLLQSSADLIRANWIRTAILWGQTELLILVLGLCAAGIARGCSLSATLIAESTGSVGWALFAGLFFIRTLLTSFVTMPGTCVSAAVFTNLYQDLRRQKEPDWQPTFVASSTGFVSNHISHPERWLVTCLPILAMALGAVATFLGMSQLYDDHEIFVTAHRGGTEHAVENTVPAIEEAIEAGAHYAEIDVQMSRDELLIVTHDSDFSRQAGIAKKVWELTGEEIQAIALTHGTNGGPTGKAPLLDEVLEAARGRIRLNIELKYYGDHQPKLAERVVTAVRDKGMTDRVIIQSLHYAGLEEVRQIAPEIPIGYLFSVNARRPKVLQVDFLSVVSGRANGSFLRAAHRRGQQVHVWTVDKPADMERLIDLGADNLITNRPREALELIRAHAELSPPERTLRRVRTWMNE